VRVPGVLAENGAARLLAGGKPDGFAGGLREGAAGEATLAALPTPLGSFSELFSPPALPGPRGMPLTPASCAKACGAHIKLVVMIKASNPNLTLIHSSPSRLLTAADCCWFRGPGLVVCFATNYRTSEFIMCNLYSITTNQEAIRALFRVVNRYVGNLPPMPGVFPDYPAPVVRNADDRRELIMVRWGMPPPPRMGGRRSPLSATPPRRIGATG
jgi:hypothetical protein